MFETAAWTSVSSGELMFCLACLAMAHSTGLGLVGIDIGADQAARAADGALDAEDAARGYRSPQAHSAGLDFVLQRNRNPQFFLGDVAHRGVPGRTPGGGGAHG